MTTSLPAPVPTGSAARLRPPFPAPSPLPSFWLTSLAPTDLCPVAAALPAEAEFAIIGGGLTGASAALHLVEGGAKGVVLLEARELAGGATGRNGGICIPAKSYVRI